MTRSMLEWSCPMPKFDFDQINLGHGSGGILTHQLLNSGVFEVLKNDRLNEKHDGAIFSLQGPLAFSTDSYVVSPLFFPGGNIGELAVNGTVNDLAMCGARAHYLSLSFIIEEGLPVRTFWEVLSSIAMACRAAGVEIVTGDTKVVEKGKGDQLFINTSGIGTVWPGARIGLKQIREGDHILLSGALAAHGIAVISQRSGLEFETDIVSDTQPLHKMVEAMIETGGERIHFMRDATRGGLASVLNEVAKDAQWGIEIGQKDIILEEQVQGACEMLGLDPLYVANEGVMIAIVDAEVAGSVLSVMHEFDAGRRARDIGSIKTDHRGQVILTSGIGGKRVVNMLPGEQLPRIC